MVKGPHHGHCVVVNAWAGGSTWKPGRSRKSYAVYLRVETASKAMPFTPTGRGIRKNREPKRFLALKPQVVAPMAVLPSHSPTHLADKLSIEPFFHFPRQERH